MALVTADVGAVTQLDRALNDAAVTNLTLKLFVNDKTPADTDIATDYTVAVGGGYVDKTLTAGSWVCSIATNIAQAAYAQQEWVFTGPLTTNLTIYGYYIVDGSAVLQWAERLDTPFTPNINGDTLRVTPIYKLSKGTPT